MTYANSQSTRPSSPILIFDIETVPDVDLLYHHYEPELSFDRDEKTSYKDLRIMKALEEQKKVTFPNPLFHIVVSICAVFVDPETHGLMDGFKLTIPTVETREQLLVAERKLLEEFWQYTIKYKDKHRTWYDALQSDSRMSDYMRKKLKPIPIVFCGYNISGFDLPVIEQRSLKHLLTCPIPEYAKETGTDSYRYKFAMDKSFDLCQFVSNHLPNARIGLDTLSRSMGLGGKLKGMDGSLVAENYFHKNAWEKIEEYCAIDVLITYGVYLAVQKFRGILTETHFKECVSHFERFLMQEGKPSSYAELARESTEFFAYAKRHEGDKSNSSETLS